MSKKISEEMKQAVKKAIKGAKSKRAIIVLKALLKKGQITTDDLNDLGYNHPPRAVGDVRDLGIPIITGTQISERTGKRMAVYTFGDASDVQAGRIGGRSALPKKFKAKLIQKYSSMDCITGLKLDERVLQIDHRIPYRLAGDVGLSEFDVEAYMLLDASSQRSKSWSCESCPNMLEEKSADICKKCYWAFPENYTHIATKQVRRVDIAWTGDEVANYEKLAKTAKAKGVAIPEFIKDALLKIK